ncbi:MAG: hypothetical protein P8I90_00830 [Glaciecola sp.]|nr:hypothetical protein [Glaciecola sp.]
MVEQSDIFFQDPNSVAYAELCNALYQRECEFLAEHGPTQASLLKRKLKHLHTHVTQCAERLLHNTSPLQVDKHNASYQAKQSPKCPSRKQTNEIIQSYFNTHHHVGSILVVAVNHLGMTHLEIDSLDKVNNEHALIHVNKFGWFNYAGQPVNAEGSCIEQTNALQTLTLLKPTKSVLISACCGHRWSHIGKISPRVLTMRELRLSFSIKWKGLR